MLAQWLPPDDFNCLRRYVQMIDKQEYRQVGLRKAFCVGILIDALLLVITSTMLGLRGVFMVLLVIVLAHLLCSVGIVLYRKGKYTDSDFAFIRFGPLVVLWHLINIFC